MITDLALAICNSALLKLGAPSIADFSDGTPAANLCNAHYDRCRLILLRMHPWNFAQKRIIIFPSSIVSSSGTLVVGARYQVTETATTFDLTGVNLVDLTTNPPIGIIFVASGTTPASWTGGELTYMVPFGYSHFFALPSDYLRLMAVGHGLPNWRVEGTSILCDIDQLPVIYTADVDETNYTQEFSEALAYFIASEIGFTLTQSIENGDRMTKLFRDYLAVAKSNESKENGPSEIEAFDWINSRLAGAYRFDRFYQFQPTAAEIGD